MTANFALTPYDTPNSPIATGTFVAPNVTEEQFNVLLWKVTGLTNQGVWFTLNVTSASEDYPFVFDYLVWEEALSEQPTTTALQISSTLTNGLALTSAIVPTTTSSTTFSGVPTSDSFSPSKHDHTGAIVGGTVGGVALLCVLALLIWYLRRRGRIHRLQTARKGWSISESFPSCLPVAVELTSSVVSQTLRSWSPRPAVAAASCRSCCQGITTQRQRAWFPRRLLDRSCLIVPAFRQWGA